MKKDQKMEGHRIAGVESGSIAEELGIVPGDMLLSVNDEPVEDIFDYRYLINDEYLTVVIRKADGEEWELEIEKEYEDDLGISFESALMDDYRSCRNKCIFCFIDQMPRGMRDTLYFKDDDSRLSFLQGNYITLTNMSDRDIDRIIRYRLEPINISFHTLNPKLRCSMLHNRFAGDVFPKIDALAQAGIEMNGQIVLCRNVNDGEELEYSLAGFERYLPALRSVSVVPVGLTKFRDGLYPLEPFTAQDAAQVLRMIHRWQSYYYGKYGTHLVHASDEWYILAGEPLPDEDNYDGYPQLENGVGMIRLLLAETSEALAAVDGDNRRRRISIATGLLAEPFIREITQQIREKFPQIECMVYGIRNDFFGESITVSGLITGTDLRAQLSGRDLGECLLLPCNMLRSQERVFLDDVTVDELENALQTKICIVESDGRDFTQAVIGSQIPSKG